MIIGITGVNSGVGQALIPKLQKVPEVEKIIGIDLKEYKGDPGKLHFFKIDIRDRDKIEKVLTGVDVLFHFAFIVLPKKLPKKKIIYDINVNGSKNVFQAAAKKNVKKIIYLSSSSVYGHVPEIEEVVKEESPRLGIKNINFYYSHTKALVEQFLDKFEQENPKIAVIRFRPPIITGIHFLENLDIFSIKKKTIITIIPRNHHGMIPIQLIHENDLTDILMMTLKKDIHGPFNISSNVIPDSSAFYKKEYNIKVKPLNNLLLSILLKISRIYPKAGWLQSSKYNSILNTEKIEAEFGWKPKFSSEECIGEIIELFKAK